MLIMMFLLLKKLILIAINAAILNPSLYTFKNPILKTSVSSAPLIINIFKTAVNTINKKTGFNPLKINLNGIFAYKYYCKLKMQQ